MTVLTHLTAPLLALIAGSAVLQAQLVETSKPSPRKTVSAKSHAAASSPKAETLKLLDKKLADFGITPRSLGTWRATGGSPSLAFLEIFFRRIEKPAPDSMERAVDPKVLQADGKILNGFQVQGADFLANRKEGQTLALLRLNRTAPQASKDGGRTWIDGEKIGEGWVFAFEGDTLTLLNADGTFTPTEFKAWALERAAVTRTDKWYDDKLTPYFHSAVVSVAYGKNEVQGLIKFPGSTFVMAFRGLRFKDRWVARALEMQNLNTYLSNYPKNGGTFRGARGIKMDDRYIPQVELAEGRIQIGTGSLINYGQEGDSAEQLKSAMEFDLSKGRALTELADAHKANLNRSLWTRSDEDGSFSREAEQAYVKTNLPVWFYPPHWSSVPMAGYGKEADACLKPILERIKRLGGKVNFIPLQ